MGLGSEWVGVVGTLAGFVAGGIVTHVVERARFKRERGAQVADLRREKLEELYQAVERQRTAVAATIYHVQNLAAGMPIPDEAKHWDTSTLTLLTTIYLPTARPALDAAVSTLVVFVQQVTAIDDDHANAEALKTAFGAADSFQRKAEELQRLTADAARALL
jgi:hypothetical protein